MTTDIHVTTAEQFFYDQAGYSYNLDTETAESGRLRCARELAASEQRAKDLGCWYEWTDDDDCDDSFVDTWDEPDARLIWDSESHTCQVVVMYKPPIGSDDRERKPVVVSSLGGIWDASDDYRRVIEAELALELMQEEASHGDHI